ncbi:MAG: 2-oxoacid:acceptor oxidoreductase subunit alpha [Planctomycetota bacterium]
MTDFVVNDFSLRIATPNGTGSQTSNGIIFKTLFEMGLAASAKNLFPSNIQGLPTWYQIRVSPGGWQARREQWEVLVALNPATIDQDLRELAPGSVVIDNADYNRTPEAFAGFDRYSVPLDTLSRKSFSDAKLRPRLRNMIYVGVIAELFDLDMECMHETVRRTFNRKDKVVAANIDAIQVGIDYAKENFTRQHPYRYRKANQTTGKIAMEGNEAAGLGTIFGGCSVVAWYPITPASSLADAVVDHARKLRTGPNGERRIAIIQAEDELAAIGMAVGAGWAGARAMTSTSGPGISLMGENLGLAYYAEVPCVVFDVQRVGPSTGLPTRTQQSDLLQVAYLSHGDTRFPILFPATPTDAFELSWKAFDIAERFQTPTFVLSDLDLGMNTWICDTPAYPDRPFDRGKVLDDEALGKLERWGRYLDVDGDGVPWRTVPGRNRDLRAAFFTRGSGHTEYATYSEDDKVYQRNLDRLARKIANMAPHLPEPEIVTTTGKPTTGLIAYGSTDAAVKESLASNPGKANYLRVRAYPFHPQVAEFVGQHERLIVVEQNQQGQMAQLLRAAFPAAATRIHSACHFGGLPIAASFVDAALAQTPAKA